MYIIVSRLKTAAPNVRRPLTASPHPVIHETITDASKEARRLARHFPASEFIVMQATHSVQVEEAPVLVTPASQLVMY